MNPEFLPEIGLLFLGLVAGALALRRLTQGQILNGLGMVALSVGSISLAVFLGKSCPFS